MNLKRLYFILSIARPHESEAEKRLVKTLFHDYAKVEDAAGNIRITVPKPDGTFSRTMFSCHTDTVHGVEGANNIVADEELGIVYKEDTHCLGADDGAGMALMLEMIDAKVPGTYVFHRGEERGGIGSRWIAANDTAFLKLFDRAVAFDRRGTTDIITFQRGNRCASDEFAQALAEQMNKGGLKYAPNSGGVFTDTANYTSVVPECTNLSVGYEHEHSPRETLDTLHLQEMCKALLQVEWEALPTKRDPSKAESKWGQGWGNTSHGWDWDFSDPWFERFGDDYPAPRASSKRKVLSVSDYQKRRKDQAALPPLRREVERMTWMELKDYATHFPNSAASLIWDLLRSRKPEGKKSDDTPVAALLGGGK